jgi:hypothetical protein
VRQLLASNVQPVGQGQRRMTVVRPWSDTDVFAVPGRQFWALGIPVHSSRGGRRLSGTGGALCLVMQPRLSTKAERSVVPWAV